MVGICHSKVSKLYIKFNASKSTAIRIRRLHHRHLPHNIKINLLPTVHHYTGQTHICNDIDSYLQFLAQLAKLIV